MQTQTARKHITAAIEMIGEPISADGLVDIDEASGSRPDSLPRTASA